MAPNSVTPCSLRAAITARTRLPVCSGLCLPNHAWMSNGRPSTSMSAGAGSPSKRSGAYTWNPLRAKSSARSWGQTLSREIVGKIERRAYAGVDELGAKDIGDEEDGLALWEVGLRLRDVRGNAADSLEGTYAGKQTSETRRRSEVMVAGRRTLGFALMADACRRSARLDHRFVSTSNSSSPHIP